MSVNYTAASNDGSLPESMSLMQIIDRVKTTDVHEGVSVTTTAAMARNRIPMLKTQIIGETSKVLSLLMESKDMTHAKKNDIAHILSKVISMVAAIDDAANAESLNLMTDFPALNAKIDTNHLQRLFSAGVITTSDFKKVYAGITTAEILLRRKYERFVEASALTFPIPITPDPGEISNADLTTTKEIFNAFFEHIEIPLSVQLLNDLNVIRCAGNNTAMNRYSSLTILGRNAMTFAMHYESNMVAESLFTVSERIKLYHCDSALEEQAVHSGLHTVVTNADLIYSNYANLVRAMIAVVVKGTAFKHFDVLNKFFKWYGDDTVKYVVNLC